MRDIKEIYGKEVKADKDQIMFIGYPGSSEIQTLPAGRPSPTINSYLPSGYFVLNGSDIGYDKDLYLYDSDSVKVVDRGTKDESSYYSRLNNALFSTWFNTSATVEKNMGFLAEGARKSFTDLKMSSFDIAKYANRIIILLIVFLILWIINKLT